MTSKKNENRQTEVKFMFWSAEDNDNGKPYEKTEKINYTRSEAIALKELSKKYPNAMIQVKEVKPDELVKIVYNSQLVFDNMVADFEYEETANENANENQTVIPYTLYEYEAHVWMKDGKHFTSEYVVDTSPLKMTVGDQRTFIKFSAENIFACECIGTYDIKRYEVKRFAIVDNDNLHMCVKES